MGALMRHVGLISLLAMTGCFHAVLDFPDAGQGGGGGGSAGGNAGGGGSAGGGTGTCANDTDCGAGMVCDPCDGVLQCAPGCRSDADCHAPFATRCSGDVTCTSCPCALHICVLNQGCVDDDGDGFVRGDASGCSGKHSNDCDDTRADVHPGAPENCTDGVDNNCNGLADSADPACNMACSSGGGACKSSFDCTLGSTYCSFPMGPGAGCCELCPDIAVDCAPNNILVPNGVDPQTGCPQFACAPDSTCPAVYSPVCSTGGSTYGNECEATRASAAIAHAGECLPGEGLSCEGPDGCGSSGTLYCRDACPTCDGFDFRCTQVGACVLDYDCPAGEAPPPINCMPGESVHAACVNHACQYTCQ
jgi:hypothetical protein